MSEYNNHTKLLKNRSNQDNQNFKSSDQIKQMEQVIEINANKNDDKNVLIAKLVSTNKLFDYFENLNEAPSTKKSKYKISIKTIKNRSLKNDCFYMRLYGLEGKIKEKKITITNLSDNIHEFDFKSFFIGQLIGISLRWIQGKHFYEILRQEYSIQYFMENQ
jgi:hypothetical protein